MSGGRLALRHAAMAAAALVLGSCASTAEPEPRAPSEGQLAAALAEAGARDGRAQFEALVCPRIAATGGACGSVLHHAGVRAAHAPEPTPRSPAAARPRLLFVAGLFAECMDRWVPAFKDVIEAVVAAGFEAHMVTVAGRGTAAVNGDAIAAALRGLPADGRGAIVFGYSKGAVDVLEAMVRHPEAMRPVSAIVTIAGAQNGSHLAESRADIYASLVAALPMAGCARGTGEEVAELRRDVRRAWWARHGRSIDVPIYSLVALPGPHRLSPFLAAGAREIARLDPHNDGNIVWRDAIAPGATLLGLVDADHWTIALPIARELPVLAPLLRDDVPRAILIEAAVAIAMSKDPRKR